MDTLVGWSVIDDGQLAVRAELNEKDFVIYATNLASLWCERQTGAQILKRCEDLNPLIETTADNLIRHLRSLLNNNDLLKKVSPPEATETIILKLKSTLDNFPFIWEYHLIQQSPDQFCELISFPLLAMLREASSVQEELCNIIRSKDKQIEDYKASGAAVSRRHLETKEFNAEQYFVSRTWRTVDESVKESVPVLFCQDIDSFKLLYSVILERRAQLQRKKVNFTSMPNADLPTKPTEGSFDQQEKDATISEQSSSKKNEMSRLDIIRKRLREEELNEIAKQAKKKPIIKRR